MRQLKGVSLLEVLLVLAVGASFLLLSIKMYQWYALDEDVRALNYNVDTLFQAAANYYKVNCSNQNNTGGQPLTSTATLDPRSVPAPGTPYILNIQTQLVNSNFMTWPALNPLVNNAAVGNGYVVQFNQGTIGQKNINACSDVSTTPCTTTQTPVVTTQGQIITWYIQVAVLLNNPAMAQTYRNMTGADCISMAAGSGVVPCASSPGTGSYLVWQRLPSFASPNTASVLWLSNPQVNSFTQQYTHDQMYELNQGYTSPQYYLCGS